MSNFTIQAAQMPFLLSPDLYFMTAQVGRHSTPMHSHLFLSSSLVSSSAAGRDNVAQVGNNLGPRIIQQQHYMYNFHSEVSTCDQTSTPNRQCLLKFFRPKNLIRRPTREFEIICLVQSVTLRPIKLNGKKFPPVTYQTISPRTFTKFA